MKKYLLIVILFSMFYTPKSFSQGGQWTWMSGDTAINSSAVYGTQGTPAAANTPPGMYEAAEWTDQNGNFWLFSGLEASEQSDLWKFDPVINEWTWVKGPGTGLQPGIYGTKGVASSTNNPGARSWGSPTWVDVTGNLWVFGGIGYDKLGGHVIFNDLWKYDISNNEWAWMAGADTGVYSAVYGTQGVFNATNDPGNRAESNASWVDKNGNLWMFGGAVYKGYTGNWSVQGSASDLWEFDITKNQWAWIKGPSALNVAGIYGTLGVPDINNNPGARDAYNKWTDANGDFWLFGGNNVSNGDKFNDLWRYNIATNTWTWMSGSNLPNSAGTAATQCTASSVIMPEARHESRSSFLDACGNLWVMGGQSPSPGYIGLNDMWKFNPANSQWTWVSGQNGGGAPVYNYGAKGVSAPTNVPPGRMGHPGWTDKSGNFWLWGGFRGSLGFRQNDLWRYVPDSSCGSCFSVVPPVASFATSDSSVCANACISFNNLSMNANSWQWSFQGAMPPTSTDQSPQTVCYLSAGSFAVTLVASGPGGNDTLTLPDHIMVNASPPAPAITQSNDTLFCNTDSTYSSYQWYDDTTLIAGATDTLLVVSGNGNYNVKVTNGNNCSSASGINIILGIKQFVLNGSGFSFSPNPSHEYIYLYSSSNPVHNIMTISILNLLGETVNEEQIRWSSNNNISIKSLPAGIYFIQILSEKGRWVGRFVKE